MEKNNYSAETNNLIALCNIIDDFEEFEKRLKTVILPKYNRDFVFQLWNISEGEFKIGARKTKKFYEENKSVIDTINKYSNIARFINVNYDCHGNPNGSLQFFYEYISNHKEEMDKILAVLGKLKELDFDTFEFNEELDFTQEIQKVYTLLYDNFNITYLDNLTAIPSYNPGVISYKTNDSGYKITVRVSLGEVASYDKKIILNNLMFDPNGLPSALSKKETFDKIIGLKDKKQQEYSVIKDSVNLGIGIADLYAIFNTVSSRINNLENVEKKAELVELLSTIKEAILQMQNISAEYDQKVADTNPSISETFLDEQKKAYVRRREDSKIHVW